jgi:hypothetical protein
LLNATQAAVTGNPAADVVAYFTRSLLCLAAGTFAAIQDGLMALDYARHTDIVPGRLTASGTFGCHIAYITPI